MNKPITIAADDFYNTLIDLVNKSGLPYFIVENTLKELLQQVHVASERQLELDKVKYNEYLKNLEAGE